MVSTLGNIIDFFTFVAVETGIIFVFFVETSRTLKETRIVLSIFLIGTWEAIDWKISELRFVSTLLSWSLIWSPSSIEEILLAKYQKYQSANFHIFFETKMTLNDKYLHVYEEFHFSLLVALDFVYWQNL